VRGAASDHHEGALLGRGALDGEGQALELGLALDGGGGVAFNVLRTPERPEESVVGSLR